MQQVDNSSVNPKSREKGKQLPDIQNWKPLCYQFVTINLIAKHSFCKS